MATLTNYLTSKFGHIPIFLYTVGVLALLILLFVGLRESGGMARSTLALLFMMAAPLLAGAGVVAVFSIWRGLKHSMISFATYSVFAGLVYILLVSYLLELIGIFNFGILGTAIIASAVVAGFFVRRTVTRPAALNINRRIVLTYGTAILLALFSAFAYRHPSPYPFHLTWDVFAHITIVEQMFRGFFSLDPRSLDDGFQSFGYPTTFHTLSGFGLFFASMNSADLIRMSWLTPFIMMPILAVTMTNIGRRFGLPLMLAALVGGVSTFFYPWHKATDPAQLIPASISMTLVFMAVASKRNSLAGVLLGCALIVHLLIGLLGLAFWGVILSSRWWDSRYVRFLLLEAGLAAAIFAIWPQLIPTSQIDFNPFTPPNWPETVPYSRYRLLVGQDVSWIILISAIMLSTLAILVKKKISSSPYPLLIIVLWLYFIPFGGAERFIMFIAFLLIAAILFAIYELSAVMYSSLDPIKKEFLGLEISIQRNWNFFDEFGIDQRIGRYGIPVLLVLILAVTQVRNGYTREFLDRERFNNQLDGISSSFSPLEMEVASTISDLTDESAILVSDPDTELVLGGLANRNTLGSGPNIVEEGRSHFRELLGDPSPETFLADVTELARDVHPSQIVLIYSGRTERWLGGNSRTYRPRDIADSEFLDSLQNVNGAQTLFKNESMLVLTVRPQED